MKKEILVCVFCMCFNIILSDDTIINEVEESDVTDDEYSSPNKSINGTLYKTVKKYFCSVKKTNESELLVYGAREWSFPAQDVTLQLDYPTKNNARSMKYQLTEVLVIVHMEGTRSEGFITSGGMMRDHISMKFVFSNITRLSYQLSLYGIPMLLIDKTETLTTVYDIC